MAVIEKRREKLLILYQAKNKLVREDWLASVLDLTRDITDEGFFYAIDCALAVKGFKFDDIVPFIKEHSFQRKLQEHQEQKRANFDEAIRAHNGSAGRYLQFIKDTLAFHNWPEGMGYMILHGALATKWEMCHNEAQKNAVLEETEKMFKEIKEAV